MKISAILRMVFSLDINQILYYSLLRGNCLLKVSKNDKNNASTDNQHFIKYKL